MSDTPTDQDPMAEALDILRRIDENLSLIAFALAGDMKTPNGVPLEPSEHQGD